MASFDKKYAIVKFIDDDEGANGLVPVELVPGKWLTLHSSGWKCAYPPRAFFKFVDKWTVTDKSAQPHWENYKVDILASASDYAQGKRRLQKAFTTLDVASSDSQLAQKEPPILSEDDLREALRETVPMTHQKTSSTGQRTLSPKLHEEYGRATKVTPGSSTSTSTGTSARNMRGRARRHDSLESSDSSGSQTSPPIKPLKLSKNKPRTHIADSVKTTDDEVSEDEAVSSRIIKRHQERAIESTPTRQVPEGRKEKETKQFSTDDIQHVLPDLLQQIVKQQLIEVREEISKKIRSSKDSILYNLNEKINELKLAIVAQNVPQIAKGTLTDMITAVETPLPIDNLEEFLEFETQLKSDENKKSALIALFHYLCFEKSTVKHCIESALPKIIRKSVQGQFSGTGRKIKGEGKRNFSQTCTFETFKVAVLTKFPNSTETEKLAAKVGTWLSHYADREGGRRQRDAPE